MRILIVLAGILTIFATAVLLSSDRRMIRLRTVLVAFGLQVSVAVFVMYVPWGEEALDAVVKVAQHVIAYGKEGIEFLFGDQIEPTLGFTVAFNVLPIIVFFAALMSLLYYLRIMPLVIGLLGGLLHRLLRTSEPESISAVSNIFVAHSEAPLVVKPYLKDMTESELFAVMTGGCATIAGAVMMGYAALGVDLRFLITASFMAAPGGLMMAKIMLPETRAHTVTLDLRQTDGEDRPVNVFEAIGNGAMTGMKVAMSVGAMLVAFVALIALVNGVLTWIGGWFGVDELTLQSLLGQLFAPVAYLLGVPWSEALAAGSLIGQKFVINEFYAYLSFMKLRESLSAHTQLVVTFALCGFANLSSIAILLGGLGAVVPERRKDIARLGLKAVVGGTLVNLMNASLAGLIFMLQS